MLNSILLPRNLGNRLGGLPLRLFIGLLILGLLAWMPVCANASTGSSGLPIPGNLKPCAPGSPVASVEGHVAAKLGGEFLGCFQSEQEITAPSATKGVRMPVEYAFAIAVQGGGYTPADLDKLLSTVKEQWNGFNPLSKEYKETYTARLNELIKGSGLVVSPTFIAIKPELVSIDRTDSNYYSVTSIRTYVLELNGERGTLTKVNSDAVVLQNSQLIRLTIQRALSNPADVADVQGQIVDWARAIAQSSLPTGQ